MGTRLHVGCKARLPGLKDLRGAPKTGKIGRPPKKRKDRVPEKSLLKGF